MNLRKICAVMGSVIMISSLAACEKKSESTIQDGSQFPEAVEVQVSEVETASRVNNSENEIAVKDSEAESFENNSVTDYSSSYEKLALVYDKMSDRFKGDVTISDEDRNAFLSDLFEVLNDELNYNQEDLNLFYLIDKKHNVGEDYVPKDLVPLVENSLYNISRNDLSLRPDVEAALQELAKAYTAAFPEKNRKLLVSSTYRSYSYQARLFQRWVDIDGLEEAERESARPGTSQHQLGVAIDFGSIEDSFIETTMGKWLNEHSEEYGWSLSFPQEYEDVTGYRWECWHFRYIGLPACRLQNKWFNDVQQYMLEFIDEWKRTE